jgi:hypothetical protein
VVTICVNHPWKGQCIELYIIVFGVFSHRGRQYESRHPGVHVALSGYEEQAVVEKKGGREP